MADKFYPRLSSIIPLDSLPQELNFIEDGIQQIFDGLGYRNYRVSQSQDGISTSVYIEIISYKELKLGIPGSDLGFSLNSDFQSGGYSIFPVSLSFSLGIRKFIRNFNVQNFSFSPQDFFNLIFNVLNVTESDIILGVIGNFTTSTDAINQVATDLISNQGLVISTPLNSDFETAVSDLLTAAHSQNIDLKTALFTQYITSSQGLQATVDNINKLFQQYGSGDTVSLIKELFLP